MTNTTAHAIDRATTYVFRHARPIDAAELAFHLGRGAPGVVLELLRAYQNPDGGFGHALEPDVRSPQSSVMATTVALQRMLRVQANPFDPLPQAAIRYLVDQYNFTTKNWPLVSPTNTEHPCAPWWKSYNPDQWGELNPRAEVISYLIRFDQARHGGLAHQGIFDEARRHLLSRLAKEDALDMHEIQCVARLLRSPGVDPTIQRTAREALERDLPKVLPRTKEQCAGYVLKPLTIARRPNSVLAGLVEHAVPVQHAYELETQRPDGSWPVPWNWDEPTNPHWLAAEHDWRGYLTMLTASSLHAYQKANA